MSKRLQVIVNDTEYRELLKAARQQGLTVSEWVREAIRSARSRYPVKDTGPKLAAVREAARHSYPTGDISEMLADIERGYLGSGDADTP
jgi:hypothetical protein